MPIKDEFCIPAKDEKGHSDRLWFAVQPGHMREIQTIIQSKRFPYRTTGDLMRHAILRHLHYLNDLLQSGEIPKSIIRQVDLVIDSLQHEQFMKDFSRTFSMLQDRISGYLKSDKQEALKLVLQVQRELSLVGDAFWRKKYLDELESLYGYLLKEAKKGKFEEFEES